MSDLPRTFVAGRLAIVVPTLAIVVLAGAGLAGWGPGGPLRAAATEPALHWVTGRETDRERAQEHREARRRQRWLMRREESRRHHHKRQAKRRRAHRKRHSR
jgi:hypothetical protein